MSNFKHQKVAGKSSGRNAPVKKDGYAKGPVPEIMVGAKPGKTNRVGYSGPNVATGTHGGS